MSGRDRLASAVFLAGVFGLIGLALLVRDEPTEGTSAPEAKVAALAATNGGRATDAEADEDGAAWEVDVITLDGIAVDVRLDEDLSLIDIVDEDYED